MIAFIDDHREAYGVEPICKVLPIAPSTYHAHIAQRVDPSKRSARAQRDAELKIEVQRVFAENFGVYGARKVWRQLRREGFTVARCTVERLMASLGLQGAIRGKPVRTTISDKAVPCPLDHVNRQFHAAKAECPLGLGHQCAAGSGVRDGGWSPAIGLQERVANHRKRRWSKAGVVSVTEKALQRRQVGDRKANTREPPFKCRKCSDDVETGE